MAQDDKSDSGPDHDKPKEASPQQGSTGRRDRSVQPDIDAVSAILYPAEAQIIAIVSILSGYLSVSLVKSVGVREPLYGLVGISFLTILMFAATVRPREDIPGKYRQWWIRLFLVVVLSVVIASPQLNNSWSAAVNEVAALNLSKAQNDTVAALKQSQEENRVLQERINRDRSGQAPLIPPATIK